MTRPRPTDSGLAPAVVREHLTLLSDRLKTHEHPLDPKVANASFAEALDAVLAPRGSAKLNRPASRGVRVNLPLWMAAAVKASLEGKAKAEAKAEAQGTGKDPRDAGTILGEVIDEGFERFLRGEFTPDRPVKKPRGKGPAIVKANLNVRANEALRDQVRELCPVRSAELGWTVTPGMVAMSWLFSEYGITEDDQIGVTVPEIPALDD